MKLLQYPQLVFRFFGILPLDGVDFGTYKCFEIIRMCLFPVPNIITCSTMFAFFAIHLANIGKSTDALFAGIGFFNAVLIYSMLMHNKRILLGLMNDLQTLLDQRMKLDNAHLYAPVEAQVQKISVVMTWIATSVIVPMISRPFIQALLAYIAGQYSLESWPLLYETVSLPFRIQSYVCVILVDISQMMGGMTVVYFYLIGQLVFIGVVWYIMVFIDDLNLCISKLDLTRSLSPKILTKSFIDVIHFHRDIIGKLDTLAVIMDGPIITNGFNLICVITVTFQIHFTIKSADYTNFYQVLCAFLTVIQQVLAFCYVGHLATTKCETVYACIYQNMWYNYPVELQKHIILIIKRAQKPYVFRGYSFLVCSLPAFKEMMNFSGSVFLLLRKFDS